MSTRQSRTADKSTNDKHTRILKALLQKPENKFCVDCRKKDPRWASFNIGCFMCIRCSGVHRSMGTHISKVKSVDLDSWTPEQVENMINWGNEKVNMHWEARLSANSIPNESTSGIDPWIRSKYEHKQFAKKGPLPDPNELGPIDEALLAELRGKSDPQTRSNRSTGSSGAFSGSIAPPPSNPSRSATPKKSAASSSLQGADLFSIGQPSASKPAQASPAQVDFFGFNDPVPAPSQPSQPPANSASQDLFSLAPAAATSPPANNQAVAPKPANTDWKNSILSLYGNQPTALKPTNQSQFGQLQGMDAFGFGQPAVQQQQQQQQQNNPWGNDDGFGAMQQAGQTNSASSFDAFGSFTSSNNTSNGFGANNTTGFMSANPINPPQGNGFGASSGFNNGGNNGVPQGGDFFSLIAGSSRPPTANSPQNSNNNKNDNAFSGLSWN